MRHQGTKILESKRLILRRFTLEDAEGFYLNVTSDSEVNKFLTWPLDESVEDTKKLLSGWVERYENPDRYCWAIVLKENEEVIGTIAAPNKAPTMRQPNGFIGKPVMARLLAEKGYISHHKEAYKKGEEIFHSDDFENVNSKY